MQNHSKEPGPVEMLAVVIVIIAALPGFLIWLDQTVKPLLFILGKALLLIAFVALGGFMLWKLGPKILELAGDLLMLPVLFFSRTYEATVGRFLKMEDHIRELRNFLCETAEDLETLEKLEVNGHQFVDEIPELYDYRKFVKNVAKF